MSFNAKVIISSLLSSFYSTQRHYFGLTGFHPPRGLSNSLLWFQVAVGNFNKN